ncbi:MAG TPA: Rid family hydrolase [Stellaceae bacterium]|nr:Rid family hydrolase [Stellaceae bacterium]
MRGFEPKDWRVAQAERGFTTRSFYGTKGGSEHFIAVVVPSGLDLRGQIDLVGERYAAACRSLGLAPETAVFRRIFLSDVLNQATAVRNSTLAYEPREEVAVSIVQQAPLAGAKLALFAYHVDGGGPLLRKRLSPRHLIIEKNGHRHLWSTRLCTDDHETAGSSAAQTRSIFGELIKTLENQGGNLRDHCVRTWIYLKDVDVFYQGMVDSRRELFATHGLTGDSHFIASTGIEGACAHRFDLVAMDAYSVLDLAPEQVSYLNDFGRLCPTKDYSVTFERGTRIAYADRAHHFISGTASIDETGSVLYPGDVLRQLDRALGNVDALLRSGQATLADMMYLLVYLRDPSDFAHVEGYLAERHPHLPTLIVQGAVCRPDWLVEVEGVAVTPNDQPALPAF